jgi:16S rRNA (guanine966-N2)-methyltransferase
MSHLKRASQMRIVAGRLKGRSLVTPSDNTIRPTSDRLRETLFNILAHREGNILHDARVLDLFAGTGALGCEALSRGAAFAVFVDEGQHARGIIRENIENLGLGGVTKVFRRDAQRLGPCAPNEPFSLVFADPPYRQGLAQKALENAIINGWLTAQACVVVEEASDTSFAFPSPIVEVERRVYGESQVIFGQMSV